MAKNIIASHSIDSIYLVSKEAGSAINNCKNQSAGPARFQIFLEMSDHHVDKGGGTTKPPAHSDLSKSPSHVKPDQTFAEVTQVTGSVSGGNTSSRTFEQILVEDLKDRNILEINLYKTNPEERGMNLTFDDLSTFIFDVLKIRHQDCVGIDYTTGRYDHREIQLKPGVDVSPYVTGNTPLLFRNHHILVKKQTNNVTKVLFRNVPLNVPDEEILNLCICYGEVLGGVTREKLNNKKDKGISGSNRAVEIILNENTSFENFYWLEGPQPGDQGRRVTVTHPGQPQQCSHCFSHDRPKYGKPLKDKCPAKGNGKACKEMEIKDRAKMADYMKELEELIGYVSLKNRYFRKLKIKPTKEPTDTDDSDKKTDEETEVSFGTRIVNPIVEKDLQIEMLRKEQEKMPALIQDTSEGSMEGHSACSWYLTKELENLLANPANLDDKAQDQLIAEIKPVVTRQHEAQNYSYKGVREGSSIQIQSQGSTRHRWFDFSFIQGVMACSGRIITPSCCVCMGR